MEGQGYIQGLSEANGFVAEEQPAVADG